MANFNLNDVLCFDCETTGIPEKGMKWDEETYERKKDPETGEMVLVLTKKVTKFLTVTFRHKWQETELNQLFNN